MNVLTLVTALIIAFLTAWSFAQDVNAGKRYLATTPVDKTGSILEIFSYVANPLCFDGKVKELQQRIDSTTYVHISRAFLAWKGSGIIPDELKNEYLDDLIKAQITEEGSPHFGGVPRGETSRGDLVTTLFFCLALDRNRHGHQLAMARKFVFECRKGVGNKTVFAYSPDESISSESDLSHYFYPTILGICLVEVCADDTKTDGLDKLKEELATDVAARISENGVSFSDLFAISLASSQKALTIPEKSLREMDDHFRVSQKPDGSWCGERRFGENWFDADPKWATSLAIMSVQMLRNSSQ